MNHPRKLLTVLLICFVVLKTAGSAAADLVHTITSGTDIAVTSWGYTADGTLDLALGFTPAPGMDLTVVRNTGPAFIAGKFNNAPQGGAVPLVRNGVTYNYIANYYGENGRSLVLQWPLTGLATWGSNEYGQLGNRGIVNQSAPVAVMTSGKLVGKTVTGIATGRFHSLALTSDGKLFAWGNNAGPDFDYTGTARSKVPVELYYSGPPAGETLVAVSAGDDHSIALASDGKAYAWGYNNYGQLGNGNTTQSSDTVAVDTNGVLAGKSLVAIAAGNRHNLALSSDGRVYGWGANTFGALGNNVWGDSSVPVAVDISGVLATKTLAGIAAGYNFSLAVSSDGKVFSWGSNVYGQLGNNSTTDSPFPVAVADSGVLAGKTIVAVKAGMYHGLALSSDGKVYAWGENVDGQLGNNSNLRSSVPVAVDTSGPMAGKTVVAIAAGAFHGMALTADGMVFAWGANAGRLGNGNTIGSTVPVAVMSTGELAGKPLHSIAAGYDHSMVLVDLGPPAIARQPVNQTATAGATVSFTAAAVAQFPSTVQWQVSPTGAAGPFSDITDNPTATSTTLTITNVAALQNSHAFRAVFSNLSGSRPTSAATLTLVDWTATLASPSDVPFQGSAIVASGPLTLQLGFAPAPGTNLTVVKNTGSGFISGTFSNIQQGATCPLTFNGVTYHYIANYYGGNGRSLVLQWPRIRIAGWGDNGNGELGNGNGTTSLLPIHGPTGGVLAGKTVVKVAAGNNFTMALTSDGKLYGWGDNANGKLGVTTSSSFNPTPLDISSSGALAGKTVVAISAGSQHGLALTSEGRVFAWGDNYDGQVGTGAASSTIPSPVELNPATSFDGQTVTEIHAGSYHSVALTSDGRVFTWGGNSSGQLGNGRPYIDQKVPGEVITSEDLSGKAVVSIAAGDSHSLALASDGALFHWGFGNTNTNNIVNLAAPTRVDTSGPIAGKTVTGIAAGANSMALTSDGMLFAWGYNGNGQSGYGTTNGSLIPLAVDTSGVLAGKTVTTVAGGSYHTLAVTLDGKVFAWGEGGSGLLGDSGNASSTVPVVVNDSGIPGGIKAVDVAGGYNHSLALIDAGPPAVTLQPSNRIAAAGATVSFTAAATDPFGFTVRWQVSSNGLAGPFTEIAGNLSATTGTLVLPGISASQANYAYRAVFSNTSGSTPSSASTLGIVNWTANLSSATSVPFHLENPVASGNIALLLSFAPAPGTDLTLIEGTGMDFIQGRFDNVPQGGRVTLSFNGTSYDFIANYYGGNGRSLVLQWPWMRLVSWGSNASGNLGNGNSTNSTIPVPLSASGALAGKVLLNTDAGANHGLVVSAEGRVFAWGSNSSGQLGDGSTSARLSAVAVDHSGVLAGNTVVATAAGGSHSLVLTSDGRVYAWGSNVSRQLGNNSIPNSSVPVAVDISGALAGKTVVSIAAGTNHSLVLSSEGRVYAWGSNSDGQLGKSVGYNSQIPVAVDTSGVLAGKTVVAISAGVNHSLALTQDGKIIGWGNNGSGQLGNNGPSYSNVPVEVISSGALAGLTVVAIAAGDDHSMALTSNGRVFSWGSNSDGQLGDSSTNWSQVPVAVNTSGALAGQSVVAIAAGDSHNLALTASGQIVSWGDNYYGQLGDGTTIDRLAPVAVDTTGVLAGRKPAQISAGDSHSLAMIYGDAAPIVIAAPLSQTVIQGSAASNIELGLSAAAVDVFPFSIRWQVSSDGSSGPFSDITGNPSASTGTLVLPNVTTAENGMAYRAVFSNNGGSSTTTAAILNVLPPTASVNFTSAATLPFTAGNVTVAGSLSINLGFAPALGTDLTIIRNSGTQFISGTFSNLPQGSTLPLSFGGVTHDFIVNYYGGNGRSLVLQWALTRVTAWGDAATGQLGNNSTTISRLPVAVNTSGVLTGKTVVKIAAGSSHGLALTSAGQVVAWGGNTAGQLGNNGTTSSAVPVAVDSTGELTGKTVVTVAAGDLHSMALTADGKVFAWGANGSGRLGNGTITNSPIPVAVSTSGVLADKAVVAIAAGPSHSLALTSDGKVVAWGSNASGQLGNQSTTGSTTTPVAVQSEGVLAGKTVVAIAAGGSFSLALTSDGRVFSWGSNQSGQLGVSGPSISAVPVAAGGNNGLINGKTVLAIAAGSAHCLALASDGRVYAWGLGASGQLGNGNSSSTPFPQAVANSGVLAGKTVVNIAAGMNHSLAVTSEGKACAWGSNSSGQMGDNSFNSTAPAPVAVTTASGAVGGRSVVAIAGGGAHTLALCGSGRAPVVGNSPASRTIPVNATVTFTASANGYPAPTVQWQQSSTGAAGTFSNITGNASANTTTLQLTAVPATRDGYAYRAVFINIESSVNSTPATLTVIPPPQIIVPASIIESATSKNGSVVSFTVTANDSLDGPLVPTCNPPSGSTFPIGTTTVNCSVTNSLGSTTNASFTVTVKRTYASFADLYQLTDPASGADPNHTGLDNLTVYAFGMNPSAPDRQQLPVASIVNGYLQISYPRWKDAADLSYIVELSVDLQTWNSGAEHSQQFSLTPIDATRERVVERDLTPVSESAHRFIRIRIAK
ncbi:MAG: HYR domain-containing protein [Verrucomicrobiota bacterium]